ncbi:TlpA family protein disulfide reductase [Cohnella endophytica]|uniref:TlpA family protein disulfide reductase n=1 Tax=Cohnella endophytica TaxID=2419778 RepID=A0A494XPH7_9BACL|nr:TlpA disulfide reductase family protein [Cohnella endophytica]RKP51631.1 TlpA family protein disulfide reductase [Cohnella endophytica]
MSNLQIGTFVLNAELLVYIVAGIFGVFAVWIKLRTHPERETAVSIAWNASFLWIAIWKGSLLLFDPASVIDHPLSLAFFSGGTKGFWIATVASIAYLWLRYRRKARLLPAQAAGVTATMLSGWAAAASLARVVLSLGSERSAGEGMDVQLIVVLILSVVALALLLSPTRRLAPQALGAALVLTMAGFTVGGPIHERGARVEQVAPDFQLKDLNGNSVSLSDYKGKTVLMNFWATWCQVCKAEMPHVEKLYEKYKDGDVVILSVNATSQERDAQRVENYVDKHGLSFPIVLDERGEALHDYRVTAYPTTYIIGPDGKIRQRYLGAFSYEDMNKALAEASAG